MDTNPELGGDPHFALCDLNSGEEVYVSSVPVEQSLGHISVRDRYEQGEFWVEFRCAHCGHFVLYGGSAARNPGEMLIDWLRFHAVCPAPIERRP